MTGERSAARGAVADQGDGGRRWGRGQRRWLVLLGVPAFGTTFAITAISTYVPSLLGERADPVITGVVIAGEGAAGLVLPLAVGMLSDRVSRTAGARARFLLFAAPLCIAALLAVATDAAPGVLIAGAAAYFVGHFAYLTPFEALYPDLVPAEQAGRSRSAANLWRFSGLGLALIGGGFLLDLWAPALFLAAAAAIVICTAVFLRGLGPHRNVAVSGSPQRVRDGARVLLGLLRDRDVASIIAASALWNFALQGLKAFVVLFFTVGLHRSAAFVSGVIFPLVAVGLLAAVPLAGRVADRVGHIRMLTGAAAIYGIGLLSAGIWPSAWMVALIPLPAAAAGAVMTLNYSALMQVLPPGHHGSASGLFLLGRGLGCLLGPLTVGLVIHALRPTLPATHGYGAMWFVLSPAVLLTVPLLWWGPRTRRPRPTTN